MSFPLGAFLQQGLAAYGAYERGKLAGDDRRRELARQAESDQREREEHQMRLRQAEWSMSPARHPYSQLGRYREVPSAEGINILDTETGTMTPTGHMPVATRGRTAGAPEDDEKTEDAREARRRKRIEDDAETFVRAEVSRSGGPPTDDRGRAQVATRAFTKWLVALDPASRRSLGAHAMAYSTFLAALEKAYRRPSESDNLLMRGLIQQGILDSNPMLHVAPEMMDPAALGNPGQRTADTMRRMADSATDSTRRR